MLGKAKGAKFGYNGLRITPAYAGKRVPGPNSSTVMTAAGIYTVPSRSVAVTAPFSRLTLQCSR